MLVDSDQIDKAQAEARYSREKGHRWLIAEVGPRNSRLVIEKVEAEGWIFVQASTMLDRERLFFKIAE